MTCPNCHQPTNRMRIYEGGIKACANCLGLSETGGTAIDGVLSRNSSRVRDQQRTHEVDTIAPHVFDHNTRDLRPNPEFMKHYPDRLTSNYTQKELEKAGMSKAGKIFKTDKDVRARAARRALEGVSYRRTPKA